MAGRRGEDVPIGIVIEKAMSWGLPASPLFAAMVQALVTTPVSSSAQSSGVLYALCMAGALAGFLAMALVPAWRRRTRLAACAGSAAGLEAAWVVLTVGEFRGIQACTGLGMALVGLSTSVLLCLWLVADEDADARVEVAKLAVGLFSAFALSVVLTTAPYLGWLSFAFPLLTGIPLWLRLSSQEGGAAVGEPPLTQALRKVTRSRAVALPILVALGAGVGLLGFGDTMVDYAMILAALVLLVPLWLGLPVCQTTGQLTAPLVVIGLSLGSLADGGAPFAIFLSGCAACLAWFWTDLRASGHGEPLHAVGVRDTALLLGLANVLAMGGLALEQASVFLGGLGTRDVAMLLCALVVVFDLVWRLATQSHERGAAPAAGAWAALAACSEATLMADFGLSAREAQVARLLCENRSVNYICASLDLSRSTVKTHVSHVYAKFGVHSRDELVARVEGAGR